MSVSAEEAEWWELFGEWGRDSDGNPKPLSVETYLGPGQTKPRYAQPADLSGLPQMPQRRLVRNSGGNEVLSTTAVAVPKSKAGAFALHSRVTLADGRTSVVLSVADGDTSGLFAFSVVNLE